MKGMEIKEADRLVVLDIVPNRRLLSVCVCVLTFFCCLRPLCVQGCCATCVGF